MPELPEVETVVRSLDPVLKQRRIEAVWTSGFPLHLQRAVDAVALVHALVGSCIHGVARRGKYLLLDVQGASPHVVLVHLGMSGRLVVAKAPTLRPPHTHVALTLAGGEELRFIDPRRFGLVKVASTREGFPELAEMGPEPLDELDEERLAAALVGSRAPLKSFLLDQRKVAGLGNIYVCEALFEASLHPRKPARSARRYAGTLLAAIRKVLERGIANRGTTLRDYVDGAGHAGGNQHSLQVYGRAGEPCVRCGALIRRRVDAGRSTFFCAGCQKR